MSCFDVFSIFTTASVQITNTFKKTSDRQRFESVKHKILLTTFKAIVIDSSDNDQLMKI